MKKIFIPVLLLVFCSFCRAQSAKTDSLLVQIEKTGDPEKINDIAGEAIKIPQVAPALLNQGSRDLAKANTTGILIDKERALIEIGTATWYLRYAPEMLDACLQGIRISRELKDSASVMHFMHFAGLANYFQQDLSKSDYYFLTSAKLAATLHDTSAMMTAYSNLESCYAASKMTDSALLIARLEMRLARSYSKDKYYNFETAYGDYGEVLMGANHPDSAIKYYRLAYIYHKLRKTEDPIFSYMENNMAKAYLQTGRRDSAAKYALFAYQEALRTNYWEFKANATGTLAKIYDSVDDKKSLYYLKLQSIAKDSINAAEKQRQFAMITQREHQHDEDLKTAQERFNFKIQLFSVIGAAVVLMVIGLILWRNNRRQKHTNLLLSEQKEEIVAQRDNLGQVLEDLKITQSQLVQREKMASLGELTAGIAHEIQNPLNFVNNFSEVNQEMIEELEEELNAGNIEEALAIAADIKQNEQKINHHGKRADGIVKGMLQHSRTGGGEKKPTNMNVMADEFLRLSYHGLRAKDKSFNAEMVTHFDPDLPKINVLPQDMGRVLPNLFNNAFYAVNQKQKTMVAGYKAEITVTTVAENGQVIIKVKDNGTGMPEHIKEKIMQPFFTTKPTGEGTGLGLSLTYDMVVKGHGGTIQVNSVEGEGSEFIIQLPIS
jgi:two-component system NtrC family sensor kinase